MPTRLLEHVSVWIDELAASTAEAFPHAMQWAVSLGLPLRVVVTASRPSPCRQGDGDTHESGTDRVAACPRLTETIQGWSAACNEVGVVLETSFWRGGTEVGMARCLRPCGLCVVAECQYERFRQDLLAGGGHTPAAALLLCPPRGAQVRRMALLYEHMNPNAAYLETAVHVCQAVGIRPLIVTVARTARDGALKRSHADGVCASLGVAADFDSIVGPEPRGAGPAAGYPAVLTPRHRTRRRRDHLAAPARRLAGPLARAVRRPQHPRAAGDDRARCTAPRRSRPRGRGGRSLILRN